MSDPKREQRKFDIVELFAGIGCVTQGFERTRSFEAVALADIDAAARETYVENFPNGAAYMRRDVRWLSSRLLRDVADGREITGILGCPPCQGFSSAGQRDLADPRNGLLAHYFRLIRSIEPAFFVMENVPRVLESDVLIARLNEAGPRYRIWRGVLNAALYGLPQTRQRAIVIGYRSDLGVEPSAPKPTHFGKRRVFDYTTRRLRRPTVQNAAKLLGTYAELIACGAQAVDHDLSALANLVTLREAIGDLPPAADDDQEIPYPVRAVSRYATPLRDGAVRNHRQWRHGPDLIRRLRKVSPGAGLLDHHGRALSRPYFSQAYSRLHPSGLARTITTNFHNPGSGRFLHYAALRTLTVREAARLQGIPDKFTLIGSASAQERLIGNAFPIPLAEALARHIAKDLRSVRY
jgi:DNA (cytosine-5)-methyltransferase 1